MLVSAGAICVLLGLVFWFDRDLAWSLVEADARFTGKVVYKPRDWHARASAYSVSLFLLGCIAVIVGLGMLI